MPVLRSLLIYLDRVAIAFSIFINVVFGGRINQTFSARNYERKRQNKTNAVKVINFLFRDKNHCLESWTKWTIINQAINKYDEDLGFDHKKRKHWYEK